MTRNLLTIDSEQDQVTALALEFREPNIYSQLSPPTFQLVRRQRTEAVRSLVVPVTHSQGLHYIMGTSHGTLRAYLGDDRHPVFAIGAYESIEVLQRGIHFTSCSTAAELGCDMVRRGARFFIGYVQDLIFDVQVARLILDADAEIDRALLSGATAGEAQNRARARFDAYVRLLRQRGFSLDLVNQVIYNRSILRGPLDGPEYGNPGARI